MTVTAQQRRLVAVLAADVAGYTRLMSEREAETHDRFMRLQAEVITPAIERYRGRIVKHTGDGFLAAFESALDAADCALAVQRGMAERANGAEGPPLLLRIGINLADVIIEPHDIFGDGVNLAARLQATAEPGGIVVSAAVAEQLRQRDGVTLGDLGEITPKNMRAVRAYALRGDGMSSTQRPFEPPVDTLPSIAVLPFRHITDRAAKGYFAAGIIEGIVHVLAGIEHLVTISHATTLAYAGQMPDPRVVGQQLSVRYILGGSVTQSGQRVRVMTELVEAATGQVIRTERHDGAMIDIFDIQDEIATQVARTLVPAVREHELRRARRKHPESLTSYDLVLQAIELLYAIDRSSFDRARGLLQQAIALDPEFASAWSHTATWHMFRLGQEWSPDASVDVEDAFYHASGAIRRDRNDAIALAIHGHMMSFVRRDYSAAAYFLDRAIAVQPSCAMAWTLSSATCGFQGDGPGAIECAKRSMRLSPLDPFAFFNEHMLSQAHYINGDYAAAIDWGKRSAARNGFLASNLRTLVAATTALGDEEQARSYASQLLLIAPNFRLGPFKARTPLSETVRETFVGRLRDAGLPD